MAEVFFGEWLKRRRESEGWTQEHLAQLIYCSTSALRKFESGERRPSAEVVEQLADFFNISPGERNSFLYFARGDGQALAGTHAEEAPWRAPSTDQKSNLPAPITSFIGRVKEQDEVSKLVRKNRLVTLAGTGGIGKTRLAIQVGQQLLHEYPDGVWFVPLAPLDSAEALVHLIAQALNFSFYQEETRARQQLLDYLREKHLFLILDSFEQLVPEGTEVLMEILTTAKNLRVLVTSRERLNLQGEQLYWLDGMQTPDATNLVTWNNPEEQAQSFSALHLFMERARSIRRDFRFTGESLTAVIEICKFVNGMPLGIELAVNWLEVLTPKEIAAEIVRSLDFLATDLQDLPTRQRSLRAMFESSWKLLSAEEQQIFQALTVFRGSFSREAAQQVSGASLRTLLGLANKSWLQQVEEGRFQIHDVLHQYGYERLQTKTEEWLNAKDRHAQYYRDFVERQEQALRGPMQVEAANILNADFGNNIQTAWDWLLEREQFADIVNRMLPGLFHFCSIRSKAEEMILCAKQARRAILEARSREQLLYQVILETAECYFEVNWVIVVEPIKEQLQNLWVRVETLELASEMGFWFPVLIAAYREEVGFDIPSQGYRDVISKLRSLNDTWIVGFALLLLVEDNIAKAGHEEARKWIQEALEIFQERGTCHEQAMALLYLGEIAWEQNAFDESLRCRQEARELFGRVGDQIREGFCLMTLANIHLMNGDFQQAFHAFREQRRFCERIGNRRQIGRSLSQESMALSRYGRLESALDLRHQSLTMAREIGNLNDIAWHTWELGEVYRLMGNLEQARTWYQQAFIHFEKLQDCVGKSYFYRGLGEIALTERQWEEARGWFQKSVDVLADEHRTWKTWSLAYAQAGLGRAFVALEKFTESSQVLREAIRNASDHDRALRLVPLIGFASLLAATGSQKGAVELATFIVAQRISWTETKKQAREVLELASLDLPQEVAQAAQAQGWTMTIDKAKAIALDATYN